MMHSSGSARFAAWLTGWAVLSLWMGPAWSTDLHRLWDDRCAECHGHAAEFARQRLKLADGRLVGSRATRDLEVFLGNHYLAADETAAVYAMLVAQVESEPRFQKSCSGCHQSAAQFARQSLVVRNGVLTGRKTGQPVDVFLQQHRNLTAADAEFFQTLLDRVATEVGVPSE